LRFGFFSFFFPFVEPLFGYGCYSPSLFLSLSIHPTGFPVTADILSEPWARVRGIPPNHCKVNDPYTLTLDAKNLKPEQLNVVVPLDRVRERPQIKDNGDGTMTVSFVPTVVGELPLNMQIDGKNIQVALLSNNYIFRFSFFVFHFSFFFFFPTWFRLCFFPSLSVPLTCQGMPMKIHVDKRTIFGADLLNLLDDIAAEYMFFTLGTLRRHGFVNSFCFFFYWFLILFVCFFLVKFVVYRFRFPSSTLLSLLVSPLLLSILMPAVPYSDLTQCTPNQPVLFNIVPDPGFTPTSTSTAFEATCYAKANPKAPIPCLVRETPDGRIEGRKATHLSGWEACFGLGNFIFVVLLLLLFCCYFMFRLYD
jgi:hypothetical protein